MNELYPQIRLIDICDQERGIRYGIVKVGNFVSDGIPVIRGGDIKSGKVAYDNNKKVTQEISDQFKRTILHGGEIVINLIGEAGHSAVVPEEYKGFNVTRDVAVIPLEDSVDTRFIDFYLRSAGVIEWMRQRLQGSVTLKINLETLRDVPVYLPPICEQKAITNILGTLDDKIELNRKTNETLEAMAKALFKSWFVDFDPVRAKAEGRPTGLPAEISDLFPDSFEDSELGEIPSGWSIDTIGNAVGEVFDGPHATPKEASDGYVFLGIKNMTGSSLDLSEKRWIGLDDWDQWTKRVVPTRGDIVFTYEAALGLFAVIPSGLTCCLGRRMALIRSRGNEPTPYFWFHQFIAEPFQRLIEERSIHGATVNRTPLTEFPQYPVLSAPIGIRNLFDSTASALWSRIHLGSNDTEKLASTRDALLPKLISGEIRIPDAEKMLEEVGV